MNERFYLDKFIRDDGYSLFEVPPENRTYDVCLASVRQCGYNLGSVPEELKTEEMCLAAAKSSSRALARFNADMEAAYEREAFLFDVIKKAVGECGPLEPVNRRIDREVSLAVPTTFDGLAALRPEDGGNFVVSVDRDTELDRGRFVLGGGKITATIRGSGRLGDAVEDVAFPGGGEPAFEVGEGVVLVLENIALKAAEFIDGGIVRLNGGVLVLKRGAIVNESVMGGTLQRLSGKSGFVSGESVNSMYCGIVSGDGMVYDY